MGTSISQVRAHGKRLRRMHLIIGGVGVLGLVAVPLELRGARRELEPEPFAGLHIAGAFAND